MLVDTAHSPQPVCNYQTLCNHHCSSSLTHLSGVSAAVLLLHFEPPLTVFVCVFMNPGVHHQNALCVCSSSSSVYTHKWRSHSRRGSLFALAPSVSVAMETALAKQREAEEAPESRLSGLPGDVIHLNWSF